MSGLQCHPQEIELRHLAASGQWWGHHHHHQSQRRKGWMSERPRVLSLYLCVCLVKVVGTTKKLDLYFQRTFLSIQNHLKIFKIKPFQGLRHNIFPPTLMQFPWQDLGNWIKTLQDIFWIKTQKWHHGQLDKCFLAENHALDTHFQKENLNLMQPLHIMYRRECLANYLFNLKSVWPISALIKLVTLDDAWWQLMMLDDSWWHLMTFKLVWQKIWQMNEWMDNANPSHFVTEKNQNYCQFPC